MTGGILERRSIQRNGRAEPLASESVLFVMAVEVISDLPIPEKQPKYGQAKGNQCLYSCVEVASERYPGTEEFQGCDYSRENSKTYDHQHPLSCEDSELKD